MSTPVITQLSSRPFLKWAGGKTRLIHQYSHYFPEFNHYYEPFLGGGAVFFHLLPSSAILMDINPELINTYRCVQANVEVLIQLLKEHEINHCQDYYYQVRSHTYSNNIEKAARFIYLNKTCFNGLYRENSKGGFNVPMGKYKNPNICNADLLLLTSKWLRDARIENNNFETILDYAHNSDDFVYFDPPYYPLNNTSNFTAYSRYPFGEDEQIKLRDVFKELAERGVKLMLSNSDCPFIREIYKEFSIYTIYAARAINSKGNKRGKITEVLITV